MFDLAATELMRAAWSRPTLDERLFALMMLGDDRASRPPTSWARHSPVLAQMVVGRMKPPVEFCSTLKISVGK